MTYKPGNPKSESLFAITSAHPLLPLISQKLLVLMVCPGFLGSGPTLSPLCRQVPWPLVQMFVSSLGTETLPKMAKQSLKRAPASSLVPQETLVDVGNTAVGVELVGAEVAEAEADEVGEEIGTEDV